MNSNTLFERGNIGTADRVTRFAFGMAIILLAAKFSMGAEAAYVYEMLFGVIVTLTGIAAWDPLYEIFRAFIGTDEIDSPKTAREAAASAV